MPDPMSDDERKRWVSDVEELLLDCIQNLMELFDTPYARRQNKSILAEEVRAIGREILDRYETLRLWQP